ncbi:TOMM precursor leader peptide-binding protein [Streptomyces sp. NPDC005925]|uniref:TOMM precursor leader peptide-binding protein n=1 Tax=Streptomyces sp. NPDC005925 TaxID=3157172 RepID=UPI0033D2114E
MLSARYEAVAATRPRIRRDVLFTETPDGVLFHNADGGFRLSAKSAYRFATLLVPHLNGDHTVAEICAAFGDRQRAMVGELVGTLYERGFARDVPAPDEDASAAPGPSPEVARRHEAQIAYVDHYADDAARRFQRFRDTRVAVVGDDGVAQWCVLSLVRNGGRAIGVLPGLHRDDIRKEAAAAAADGCPVDVHEVVATTNGPLTWDDLQGYDVVVVTGGPEAPRTLLPLLRQGVPAGCTLIPAWSYGRHAVVGPATSAQTSGCWACAVLRLGAGDGAAHAADLWSSLALDLPFTTADPEAHPGGPLSAMLGNLLGYEVFRLTTGALPAETLGQVIIQDTESLDVTTEPLLAHPRCPWCADHTTDDLSPIDLGSADTDALALPTVDTARDADALVEELNHRSVLLRPYTGVFRRYDDEDITQTPLKLSVVELALGHGRTRRVAAADVHHVAGARLRALHRAAETYAEHVVPPTRAAGPGSAVRIPPNELATSSGIDGAEADVRHWLPATSLLTKEPFLVPAEAVRPFGADNRDRLFEATGAGMRAGASDADAAARGVLSALAHDALRDAVWAGRATVLTLPEDPGPELTFLLRSAANLGVEAELLDLGARGESGVAVVLARAGARWTLAAELSYPAAASAALRDLLAGVQLEQQGLAADTSFGDPELRGLDPRTLTVTGTTAADPAATASWPDVLRRLGEHGRDALAVRTGSADLRRAGIHVVRVLLTSEARHAG